MEDYRAYVGLDWSCDKHDFNVSIPEQELSLNGTVQHEGDEVRALFDEIQKRAGGRVAVCLEQARGPLFNVLAEIPGISIYPTNPVTLARLRKAFTPSGAKDDVRDAVLARELVEHHRSHLRKKNVEDDLTQRLDLLSRSRRDLVDDRTRISLKLRDVLKQYFPLVLSLFDDLYSPPCLAFVEEYKELVAAQASSDEELFDFFVSHGCRRQSTNENRINIIRRSSPLIRRRAVIEVSALHAKALCSQLRILNQSIAEFDKEIQAKVKCHDDHSVFASFPRAGAVTVARLISAFGTERERFQSAEDVLNCFAVSPIKIQSGRTELICARVAKSKFLHQTIVEWAATTIVSCSWAKAFYRKQRAKGKNVTHRIAVRALAFKWCRILFHCWKSRIAYDEAVHLKNLEKAID